MRGTSLGLLPLIPRRRKETSTKEAVTARLAAAEVKRQRRRERNLRTVAAGGIQAA